MGHSRVLGFGEKTMPSREWHGESFDWFLPSFSSSAKRLNNTDVKVASTSWRRRRRKEQQLLKNKENSIAVGFGEQYQPKMRENALKYDHLGIHKGSLHFTECMYIYQHGKRLFPNKRRRGFFPPAGRPRKPRQLTIIFKKKPFNHCDGLCPGAYSVFYSQPSVVKLGSLQSTEL